MESSFRQVLTVAIILSLIRPVGLLIGLGFEPMQGYPGRVISATMESILAGIFFHLTFFTLPKTVFTFRNLYGSGSGFTGPESIRLCWRLAFTATGCFSVVVIVALLQLIE